MWEMWNKITSSILFWPGKEIYQELSIFEYELYNSFQKQNR